MRPTQAIAAPLLALLVAGFLLVAGPATAIYIVTPLILEGDTEKADVGDVVHYTVRAQNDTEAAAWGGKTVQVIAVWTENQTENPDGSVSDGDETRIDVATLALDGDAAASFDWTVPEAADDKNVNLRIVSDEAEEPLAFADLAVGDAEPIMKIAASGPSGEEPVETPLEQEDDAAPPTNDTPGLPLVLGALAVAGAAVLARRKRG